MPRPAPTPPYMRVRIRRFNEEEQVAARVISATAPVWPAGSCDPAFLAFRQALLLGARQVSPDKSVIGGRTSSSFTCGVVWERLRDVVLTRLSPSAWDDVSVRSLAALVRMRPTAKSGRCLRTHSQASFLPQVAPEQLPSPRTWSLGAIIWYADLLETPTFVHGTFTR